MNLRLISLAIVLSLAAVAVRADAPPTLSLGDAEVAFDAKGALTYTSGGKEIRLGLSWYAPGWSPKSQKNTSDASLTSGENTWTWTNQYAQSGGAATLTQHVEQTDDGLVLTYTLVTKDGFGFEGGSKGPFLELNLSAEDAEGVELNLSGKTHSLPVNNKWSYGGRVLLDDLGFALKTKGSVSMSTWKSKSSGATEIRVQMGKPTTGDDGATTYELIATLPSN